MQKGKKPLPMWKEAAPKVAEGYIGTAETKTRDISLLLSLNATVIGIQAGIHTIALNRRLFVIEPV